MTRNSGTCNVIRCTGAGTGASGGRAGVAGPPGVGGLLPPGPGPGPGSVFVPPGPPGSAGCPLMGPDLPAPGPRVRIQSPLKVLPSGLSVTLILPSPDLS